MRKEENEEQAGKDNEDGQSKDIWPGGTQAAPCASIFCVAKLEKTTPIFEWGPVLEAHSRPAFTPLIQCQNGSGDDKKIDKSCIILHF